MRTEIHLIQHITNISTANDKVIEFVCIEGGDWLIEAES